MCNNLMDKYEFRRLAFQRLVDSLEPHGQAKIAKATGITANYLSRMLYQKGKPQKKNIGEDIVEKLTEHYPGWLDVDLTDVYENPFVARARTEREHKIREIIAMVREMDDTGLNLVFHSAKIAVVEHPLRKQTQSFQ